MLRHLRATNFAILSDVGIELGHGLNVLTGETGAGKSLIVEAVNLLRGGRASANIPRAGAKEAVVEAVFEVPADLVGSLRRMLTDAGLPDLDDGDNELLVRRIISRGGRSRTYINGALTTAGRLALIGASLVDLSSQHQHQGLTDARRHVALLDAFSDDKATCQAMVDSFARVREIRGELERLADGGDLEQRLDYLRFQLEELDEADLDLERDGSLEETRKRLTHADRLTRAATEAESLLYSTDRSAADRLDAAEAELERAASLDAELGAVLTPIRDARALVDDATATLREYASGLECDPAELAVLEERAALVARLRRKHGPTLEDVIAKVVALRADLAQLEGRDEARVELEASLARALRAAGESATALSETRRAAAERLTHDVGEALGELGMKGAELAVAISTAPLSETGADHVELMLRANRGEDAKPLVKVASGGELSRIMLAIKLVLRRAEEVSCYVFDEVDSGIGGKAAEVVGRQIQAVAQSRQVLCVTHLAPIAAFADHHYRVEKLDVDGRTETQVDRLGDRERAEEIARMLGGSRITKRARAHAREMLAAAR